MAKVPFRVSPMLATPVDTPFARPDWVFEEKYDGVRILAYKEGPNVTLISRNALDRSGRYPEIVAELSKLKADTLALDGEVVIFDPQNISRFQLLQQSRGRPQYVVFDCLYEDGVDLRREPLSERRKALERHVKARPDSAVVLAERLAPDGLQAFEVASQRGLEGMIGKRLNSTYFEARSTDWMKVKVHQEEEFVIGGFTAPAGSRQFFGALLLGVYSRETKELRYVGKVGSGFNEKTLRLLHHQFEPLISHKSPFGAAVPERAATFVAPKLVAQIAFTEWTKDGKLRHPVFLGLRDDKNPREVVRT
jgi:bifunctional non-homologous end joining protein LigD